MRTQEEIKQFENFLNIIQDKFACIFFTHIKNQDKVVLKSWLQIIKDCIKQYKEAFLQVDENVMFCVETPQLGAAENILEWILCEK